jgi:hypothetical protein
MVFRPRRYQTFRTEIPLDRESHNDDRPAAGRTATARGRQLRLAHAVRAAADEERGRTIVRRELLAAFPGVATDEHVETIPARIVAMDGLPAFADDAAAPGRCAPAWSP